MRRISRFSLAAIPTLIAAAVVDGQPSSSTTTGGESLRVVAPWFGAGLGVGRVRADEQISYLEAPGPAVTLHAGAEIATRIFLSAEFYGQSSFLIFEDSKNSASFATYTIGARAWRGLMLKGGWGSGTYSLDDSHPVHNAPARELGIEWVGPPRPAQGSLFLQSYATRTVPSQTGSSGIRLTGFVFGASLRVYLLDAILDYPR